MPRSGNSTDEGGTCKRLCDFGLRFDVMDDIGDDPCRVEKIVGDGLCCCHVVLLVEVNLGLVHRRLYLIQVNSLSFYLLLEVTPQIDTILSCIAVFARF